MNEGRRKPDDKKKGEGAKKGPPHMKTTLHSLFLATTHLGLLFDHPIEE